MFQGLWNLICSIFPHYLLGEGICIEKLFLIEEDSLKIIIGIKNNSDNRFESHAWVTFNDEIILNNENKIESYKVIHKI